VYIGGNLSSLNTIYKPLPIYSLKCHFNRPVSFFDIAEEFSLNSFAQTTIIDSVREFFTYNLTYRFWVCRGALACLLLALQYGGVTHAWNSSVIIVLLVGFFVMVIALIIAEIWQGERVSPRLGKSTDLQHSCPGCGLLHPGGCYL
jgi:hypothetical protein